MNRSFFISIILFALAFPVSAKIVINEVAWMGTATSATDEWIELYSDHGSTGSPQAGWNLSGWTLVTADGGMKINLKSSSSTENYYLIERTDDNAVPGIKADLISAFGKGLSNDGEILILKDAGGNIVDQVDGSNGWPVGGDSGSKQTLQRAKNEPARWITAVATPKAENANYIKKIVPAKSSPTVLPGEKSDFKEGGSSSGEADSEYLWLLGGILGGALLGLAVIFGKRFRS